MKLLLTNLILAFFVFTSFWFKKQKDYDVVVYGGTSAGIASAIQSSRMGKSVVLIEPTNRLGGLTTGGLGQTDIGNKYVIGGISREFYQNISKYYQAPENWKWQKRSDYIDEGQTRTEKGEDAMWTFEPSAALKVYHQMLSGKKIDIVYGERLNRETGVIKKRDELSLLKWRMAQNISERCS